MKARQKRFLFIGLAILGIIIASVLALIALQENLSYFFNPSQVTAGQAPTDEPFRLGGLVVKGSLVRKPDGLTVIFAVTDRAATVLVTYTGILPDLFSEGRGVITRGRLQPNGVFQAEEVLAKHDETYLPPEVARSLQPISAPPVPQVPPL